jgi:hypothetical protein
MGTQILEIWILRYYRNLDTYSDTVEIWILRSYYLDTQCSTTGKPTRSFATERVSLDSV